MKKKPVQAPQKPPSVAELVEADKRKRADEFGRILQAEQERLRVHLIPFVTLDGRGQVTGGFKIEPE